MWSYASTSIPLLSIACPIASWPMNMPYISHTASLHASHDGVMVYKKEKSITAWPQLSRHQSSAGGSSQLPQITLMTQHLMVSPFTLTVTSLTPPEVAGLPFPVRLPEGCALCPAAVRLWLVWCQALRATPVPAASPSAKWRRLAWLWLMRPFLRVTSEQYWSSESDDSRQEMSSVRWAESVENEVTYVCDHR